MADIRTNPIDVKLTGLDLTKYNKIFDYTPIWFASAGTAVSIGNGTMTGYYVLRRDTMLVQIKMNMGTTTAFGNAGFWAWTYPNVMNIGPRDAVGSIWMAHAGVGFFNGLVVSGGGGNSMAGYYSAGSVQIGFNNPFVWAANDQLLIQIEVPLR